MEEYRKAKTWGEGQKDPPEEMQGRSLFPIFTRTFWGRQSRNYYSHFIGEGNLDPEQFYDLPRIFLLERVTANPQSQFFRLLLHRFFLLPQMVSVGLALTFKLHWPWMMDKNFLWASEPRLRYRCQTHYGLSIHSCCSSVDRSCKSYFIYESLTAFNRKMEITVPILPVPFCAYKIENVKHLTRRSSFLIVNAQQMVDISIIF